MCELKPIDISDLALLSTLEKNIFAEGAWRPQQINEFLLASHNFGYILYNGVYAIGYILWMKVYDNVDLLRIGVLKEERHKGYGRILLQAFIDAMEQASDVEKIFLEVRADRYDNQKFYTAMGFKLYGRRKKYYSDDTDALLYAYDLKE